ncbi:MAG: alpha/beta fold hydrolase [Spirochaetes bacterium]|nr:alpha/beta fold hydrolase [Spirochaetota bacterium]
MKATFVTKYLKTPEGGQMFFRFWKGKKTSPVLIFLHGLGSHSLRLLEMAEFFRRHSFNIYAFDLSGFGKSQAYKGHIDKFDTYINETLAMLKLTESEIPSVPKFLVCEDMGGVIGINFSKYYQDYFDGMILLSPLVAFHMDVSLQKKLETAFNTLFNKFNTYDAPITNEMLTRDYKMQKLVQSDELDVKVITGTFYFALQNAMKECMKNARKLELPVLLLQGDEDAIVNQNSVFEFFNRLGSVEKHIQILKGFYHALAIDKDRDIVFNIMLQWLIHRLYILNEFGRIE